MRLLTAMFALIVALFAAVPAFASIVRPSDYKCPLGGEIFRGRHPSWMYIQVVEETRGMPLGPPHLLPIEQCPNGFLIAKPAYNARELVDIARLIAMPEYRALQNHPTFEQLWWLRREQGADNYELAELMLQASREGYFGGEDQRHLEAKYLITISTLSFATSRSDDWFLAYLKGVDVLRVEGRFDEARQLLAAISAPVLQPKNTDLRSAGKILSQLIAERNDSRVPVTMINLRGAAAICLEPSHKLSRSEVSRCETSQVRRAMVVECERLAQKHLFGHGYAVCQKRRLLNNTSVAIAILLALILLAATFWQLRKSDPKRSGTRS